MQVLCDVLTFVLCDVFRFIRVCTDFVDFCMHLNAKSMECWANC